MLLSPHGRATGVYSRIQGSLSAFGVGGIVLERDVGAGAGATSVVAERWGAPLLGGAVDHGVLVPLLTMSLPDVPLVAATLADGSGLDEDRAQGAVTASLRLAHALRSLSQDRQVAFVASANTAAALSPRAPYTERSVAIELEDGLLGGLGTDAGLAQDLARDMSATGMSCGVGPLTAFGDLCRGSPVELVAYERPVGVGYVIARAEIGM